MSFPKWGFNTRPKTSNTHTDHWATGNLGQAVKYVSEKTCAFLTWEKNDIKQYKALCLNHLISHLSFFSERFKLALCPGFSLLSQKDGSRPEFYLDLSRRTCADPEGGGCCERLTAGQTRVLALTFPTHLRALTPRLLPQAPRLAQGSHRSRGSSACQPAPLRRALAEGRTPGATSAPENQ